MINRNKFPVRQIVNRMVLRILQYESLQILDDIVSNVDLAADLKIQERVIKESTRNSKRLSGAFNRLRLRLLLGLGRHG
jgi:hypothetical protein